MTKITVSLRKDHPTGTMRRCGFAFTKEPQTVDVDDAQLEIIKSDAYLVVAEGKSSDTQVVASSSDAIDFEAMTANDLKKFLTKKKVEFGARASKSELVLLARSVE